ncbi:MAG: hypothetical protein WDO15_08505 [Bacteroidota bacterium]
MKSQTIGNFVAYEKIEFGVEVKAEKGTLRVLVYSESIVKVSVSPNGEYDDFSYAVVASPSKSSFTVTEMNRRFVFLLRGSISL